MTEHEQLKEICDKIGYEIKTNYIGFLQDNEIGFAEGYFRKTNKKLDVREIIFTQEFMDLYIDYYFRDSNDESIDMYINNHLLDNLNNPVEYLYNLIK